MNPKEKFDAKGWDSIEETNDSYFSKRIEGPTPNGAYAIEYFYDENGKPCSEEQASVVHIHEFDENNNFVFETVGYLNSKSESDSENAFLSANKFNARDWDSEYNEGELTGFRLEYYDFQLITYDRFKKELQFTINSNKKQLVDTFNDYSLNLYPSVNTVLLSNAQNNELTHLLEADFYEKMSEDFSTACPMALTLFYSDDEPQYAATQTNRINQSKTKNFANKFLKELESYLRDNFKKEMWEIDYDVEYHCPACNEDFKKAYSGVIFHEDESIICPYCRYDLKRNKAASEKKKKQKDKKPDSSNEENERSLKSLKAKKNFYVFFMIISLIIALFFLVAGFIQGFLGGILLFFIFLIFAKLKKKKIKKLQEENET